MAQENYKTFDFAPYESNFAKGRREELADRTRQEFDANKAEYDILQRSIGALETTDFNKKYVDQMNADIEGTMQGVLETGRYDLASFAVSDSLTRYMTDNTVKNAVEGFQTRKKEKQVIAANPNKYHDYNIVPARIDLETGQELTAADYDDPLKMQNSRVMYDPQTDAIIEKDLSEEHDAATGAYLGNFEEIMDHQGKAYTMMKGIADDTNFIENMIQSYKRDGVNIDAATAKKFIMSGRAITDGKVQGLAEQLLQMYSDTPEGLQRAKDLARSVSSSFQTLPDPISGTEIPILNTNSPEEIQAALLNDLITAGQTQIGQTMTTTAIPQDRVSTTTTKPSPAPYDFSTTIEVTEERQKIIDARKKAKERIAKNNSVMFSSDGSLNSENKKENPAWESMDNMERKMSQIPRYITQKEDETLARVTEKLAAINSNNPLDIAGEYERAVYIKNSGQFDYLKTDKDNNPIEVSDVDFIYAVEESLANSKYVSEVLYQFRDASSQKGSTSGFKSAAQHIIDLIRDPGTLIFDESSNNPEIGLAGDQWSANTAKGKLQYDETSLNNLVEQLSNYVKGESTNTANPTGITLNNASPGAIRVPFEGRNLNIQTGERLKKMLNPASDLINLVKNPLDGGQVILPDIASERTPEEIEKGIFTVVEAAPRSKGTADNFKVNVEWYTYKVDASGNPVSNSKILPVSKVNQFVETAVLTAMQFGPDTSKNLRDTEVE